MKDKSYRPFNAERNFAKRLKLIETGKQKSARDVDPKNRSATDRLLSSSSRLIP